MKKVILSLVIAASLLAAVVLGVTGTVKPIPSAHAASYASRQFEVECSWFVSNEIVSGYNQKGQWKTWYGPGGYSWGGFWTQNWWWSSNVNIQFTYLGQVWHRSNINVWSLPTSQDRGKSTGVYFPGC